MINLTVTNYEIRSNIIKLIKVKHIKVNLLHGKSENKFHYSPPWREYKGGLLNKDIYFLILKVLPL